MLAGRVIMQLISDHMGSNVLNGCILAISVTLVMLGTVGLFYVYEHYSNA